MTVLLLVATFLVFALVDYLLNRKRIPKIASEAVPAVSAADHFVNGFYVPEDRQYHSGHTWVLSERKGLARIGADEFAAALAGKVEAVELPRPGQWVRQGQKLVAVTRNGERTELVSPVEGEIAAVNTDLAADASLLRQDPYGKGWFATVTVPDEENTFRNLVPRPVVRTWMNDAVARLYALQPLAGAAAADGGRPVEDLLAGVPQVAWERVTREFFLTA